MPTGNFLFRKNDGVTVDHVYTHELRVAAGTSAAAGSVSGEPNVRQHEGLFDPATLGFSPAVLGQFGGAQYFPHFDFDTLSDIGDNLAGNTTHSIYSFQPTYTRMMGKHSVQAGYDMRLYREFGANAGRQAGDYLIRNNAAFTRQLDNSTSQNWQDVASFLLGLPTGGSIEVNGTRLNSTWYHGVFVQDDWTALEQADGQPRAALRVRRRARPIPRTATFAASIPSATLSITSAAEAAYAANPIPQVPASAFRVRGGLQFASDDQRGFWNADGNNIQPRAGFAYQLDRARRSCAAGSASTPCRSSLPATSSRDSRRRRRSYRRWTAG